MGATVSRSDFLWVDDNEPHAIRRKEILTKHPEIKSLMVIDHNFKYVVSLIVFFQLFMAYLVAYFDFSWLVLFLITYVVSGTLNQSLVLATHDISHNCAFGNNMPRWNKLFGMFSNLPLGIPISMSFRKYHRLHHHHLGTDTLDPDLPTLVEAKMFNNSLGKTVWMFLQPLFYSIRPFIINPLLPCPMELFSMVIGLSFDAVVGHYLGRKSLFYMIAGTFLGSGLHPIAGHFISEHYMINSESDTNSYYGPLNKLTFNVGYHNEHHDFPSIPSSLLPKVKDMAPEYYDNLPYHTSWTKVIYDYIIDPSVGPYARKKREKYLDAKRKAKQSEEAKKAA